MHPLALTTAQLNFVMAAAKAMPVEWRSRYLAAIADELLALPVIEDGEWRGPSSASARPWVELQHDRGYHFCFQGTEGQNRRGAANAFSILELAKLTGALAEMTRGAL
jgi:hypothetical protein